MEDSYPPHSNHRAARIVCDLCFRECLGLCIQYRASKEFPAYHACKECDDALLELAIAGRGFISASVVERMRGKAVIEARAPVFDAFEAFGHHAQLYNSPALDDIIRAVFAGVSRSMQAQSASGEQK